MQFTRRRGLITTLTLPLALLTGCARPGPPKPPSLHLPAIVTDLSASRAGDTVELHLTAPRRASDGVPLPPRDLRGTLCRQLGTGSCITVGSLTAPLGGPVTTHDVLPPDLTSGPPRLLSYRVEFFNATGHSIGKSEPAYSVAGATPAPVEGLTVTGARNGIVLTWKPTASTDEVLLEREDLAPHAVRPVSAAAPKPHSLAAPHRAARHAVASAERSTSANVLFLQANAEAGTTTLDATADPDTPYRYRALRRRYVQLGGRRLELRSAPSAALDITLHETYPPAAPTGLTTAAYFDHPGAFAVDLIWQPVDDDTRTATLAGYNIYRETLDAQGNVNTPRTRLNPTPTLLPSFHDTTAKPGERYRYSVTAIDTRANESEPATTLLNPQPAP